MLSQKRCINFYNSGEFLHFDLHKFFVYANNSFVRCTEDKFRTERSIQKQTFLIVLLACADSRKIFFQVLGETKHFVFTYP